MKPGALSVKLRHLKTSPQQLPIIILSNVGHSQKSLSGTMLQVYCLEHQCQKKMFISLTPGG